MGNVPICESGPYDFAEPVPEEFEPVLTCSECLARHSEYMDGVMDPPTADLWRAHISACGQCGRYDRVLRRGLRTLSAQPPVELDSDFASQLHRRLATEDRRYATRPIASLATASVAVAAMLAFAAWLPVLMLSSDPEHEAVAAPASQVASEIAWHGESAVVQRASSHVRHASRIIWPTHNTHVIETKYTPVVLQSPIAPLNYAQTISPGSE